MKINYKRLAGVLALVLLALFSGLFLGDADSHLALHTEQMIEERIDDALTLSTASAISSVVVTLLPEDIATPVAEKMADLTQYFIVALLFLYTEKFLMAILGIGVFKIMIPAACLILAVLLYKKNDEIRTLTLRATAFALILFIAVPLSTRISDIIYSRYAVNIDEVVNSATTITASEEEEDETKGILDIISEKISGATANFTNKVGALLHAFLDILAVAIVSSCVIPLLVLAFLIWILNKLFGLKVLLPKPRHSRQFVGAVRGAGRGARRRPQTQITAAKREQPGEDTEQAE